MKNKRILVINLGWEQEPMLDKLASTGAELYGVHYNGNYYQKIKYHDILISDLRDLTKIIRFAEKIKPDAVISDQCDYSYFAQALICDKYGLPGPGIKEAQIATNKYLQRFYSADKGIPCPEFQLCFSVDDVHDFVKKNDLPVMVKSVDNRGSFGVNKVSNVSDIEYAYYDALINSHSRYVIVEKYIQGTHLTVDGYCFTGSGPKALAVASKTKLSVKDSIIDGEIIYPAQISKESYAKAEKLLEKTANAFRFKFGFLHGEFILDAKGDLFLTEIANRGGGVYTSEVIVPNFTGFDIVDTYINDVLGDSKDLWDSKNNLKRPTALKFFSYDSDVEGIVKKINGIEFIEKEKNVLRFKMLIKKGDIIKKVTNGAERHGMIIYTTDSAENLIADLNKSLKNLEVEIEKD